MLPALDNLISRFRIAQDIAVDILINRLSIPKPESNRAWVSICEEKGLYATRAIDGVGIYTHGYGIELKIDELVIDFDWGTNGEPDGFDGWRLWSFSLENCPDIQCSHDDTNGWLERAHGDGELIKDGSLYYDPKRRADGLLA